MEQSNENDIQQLNGLLQGELSAVQTYEQVIAKVDDPALSHQMKVLQESHRSRAILLSDKIVSLGGEPEKTSGAWGSMAKLAEGSACLFGTTTALSMLEEGEAIGRHRYRRSIDQLSYSPREFVRKVIYPEQSKTHVIIHQLVNDVQTSSLS